MSAYYYSPTQYSSMRIFLFLFAFLFPFSIFAGNVDVVANPSSGTYHAPIYITLTPTDPLSKTFYSFKPDGYPQDAFLYEKPILLKQSSPFVYFSIVSTTNESKIKQQNYILEYSSDIHLESARISGSGQVEVVLVNSGSEEVNIGLWHIQSELEDFEIPEGTLFPSSSRQTFRLKYAGNSSIVLRSPDGEEKDIIIPQELVQEISRIPPKKPIVRTSVVPRKTLSIEEIPVKTEMEASSVETKTPETYVSGEGKREDITPVPFDINQVAKASISESGESGVHPIYLVLF